MKRSPNQRSPWRALLWIAFGLAVLFAAFRWLVPWLGRRGNLNALIEGVIRSSLTVPVKIGNIETEPFSELRVTRLESISAEAGERFGFGARSLALRYDPLEILSGKIRSVVFEAPTLQLDLDTELSGIARIPERPAAPGAGGKRPPDPSLADEAPLLPFVVGTTTIENGSLVLKWNGRKLELGNLRLDVTKLGELQGQTFTLSVETLGGVLRAWGGVDVAQRAGAPTRFTFREARVILDHLDAARLVAWLLPDPENGAWPARFLHRARGALELEGSLDGTWPETVNLHLTTHASDITAEAEDVLALSGGQLGIHLNAQSEGDLERITFSLSTHGEGRLEGAGQDGESGELEVEGELRRHDGEHGTLALLPSRVVLREVGEVRFSGKIGRIFDTNPVLDLSLECPSLDGYSLLARLPPVLRAGLAGRLVEASAGAEVSVSARLGGTAGAPKLDGSFEAHRVAVPVGQDQLLRGEVKGSWKGLQPDEAASSWSVEELTVETGPLEAPLLARAAGFDPARFGIAGTVAAELHTTDQSYPIGSGGIKGRCRLEVARGAWTLPGGAAGVNGVNAAFLVEGSFHPQARKLFSSLEARGTAAELLIDWFYADPAGRRLQVGGEVQASWDREGSLETLDVTKASIQTPFSGPVTGALRLFRTRAHELAMDLSVEAPRIPGREAFPVFVSGPLESSAPFLAGGELDGVGDLLLRIEGKTSALLYWGRLRIVGPGLLLGAARFENLDLDVPFELGPRLSRKNGPEEEGHLHLGRAQLGGLTLDSPRVDFRLRQGAYALDPMRLGLYGGTVELRNAVYAPLGAEDSHATVNLRARGLDVERIGAAHGLRLFPGKISADLSPLALNAGRLDSSGAVSLEAFGGLISLRDLTIENIEEPYAAVRLKGGKVSQVRLADVGRAFRFGVMSGVLNGEVSDVGFVGGEFTSFVLDAGTVPTRGVAQYLDRSAVESIRRVFSGPLGAIEETFFSRFRYSDFGFRCSLDDGIFRFRGKYEEDGVEYIMRSRWYLLPQINIINARPDELYDWRTIQSNLRRISEGKSPP